MVPMDPVQSVRLSLMVCITYIELSMYIIIYIVYIVS